jgi:hypothetical protein
MNPVFVVGAPRSGTTLVYSILLASGEFPVYEAESRILECSTRYRSLRSRRNFERFAGDYRRARQFARSRLDPEVFFPLARSRAKDYAEFLRVFMGEIAALQGKDRWAEKTPNHVLYMTTLARAFPGSSFLHIVRDGRDVALSQRSVGMTGRYSRDPVSQLLWGAKIWEMLAREGRASGSKLGDRYLELKYEDVVTDVDGTLAALNRFLGLSIDRQAVTASRIGALGKANTPSAVPEAGISTSGVQRWSQQLERREVALLDWAIGDCLESFGYRLSETSGGYSATRLNRLLDRLIPPALVTKRFLNRHTPLGRFARPPLEIGLE